ncbi:dnaJ [Symbiodinium sp. CCMP2592]|nr:dnaJ [Symbiodinium sp. CCMP2592]
MSSDWNWINLPGGHAEQLVADLEALPAEDGNQPCTGRGMIVVQTNATCSFHISFSSTDVLPTRGTDVPTLRFVVGKRRNTMTSVGLGNPYLKKEPIDFTRQQDALLTSNPERSRTFWFLYDKVVQVAAMGVQGCPQADVCRLLCRFQDSIGFRAEVCENLRYIVISSGKLPVSLRIVHVGPPPDVSIPRHLFDPVEWKELPWQGCSCIFELDEQHLAILKRIQSLLSASPLGPLYQLVPPECLCLNPARLLDPFRRPELLCQGPSVVADSPGDEMDWRACFEQVQERLAIPLHSGPWTYWPLRFDRADCTTVTLVPTGPVCQQAVSSWVAAVQQASGLRNAAVPREMLTLTFAYEVFPVEGENASQVRRDLVREIKAILDKEWGVMEFIGPKLALWQTKSRWLPFQAAYVPSAPTP